MGRPARHLKWEAIPALIVFLFAVAKSTPLLVGDRECPAATQDMQFRPVLFDTAPFGDSQIRIYRWLLPTATKYYFAPLALVDRTSVSSSRNNLSGENQLVFRVHMWSDELVSTIADYLVNVTGVPVAQNHVSVLPFEKVSMRCRHCISARPDSHWRSFSHSPRQMEFRMVCPTQEECHNLAEKMAWNPEQVSSHLSLLFRLDASSSSPVQRKTCSIASEHIWSGPLMTDLNGRFSDSSSVLVVMQDRLRIVSEILKNVLAAVDIDYSQEVAVEPDDERRLTRILENLLFEHYIIPLEDGNPNAWDSLYWENESTRPDIVAQKLNRICQNANDAEREWMGRQINYGSAGASLRNDILTEETLRALAEVFQVTVSQVYNRLQDSRRFLKWNENSFVPKITKLSKINLSKLRNSFQTITEIPVRYSTIDLKLELNVQPSMPRMSFPREPQPSLNSKSNRSSQNEITNHFKDVASLGSQQTENEGSSGLQGFFQTIRGAITGGGLETAPYTVLRTEKDYEERLYPAQKWVRTQMKHTSKDAASSPMFWKLFNYISGQNSKQIKIPMTTPVSIFIEPGTGEDCESTFTMAFYVPAAFEEDTPQPTEDSVSVVEQPEFKVFTRTYGGFSNDRATKQEHETLWNSLSEDDKQLTDKTSPYFYAGYDPPFKPFFRRNEIWIIQKADLASVSESTHVEENLSTTCDAE